MKPLTQTQSELMHEYGLGATGFLEAIAHHGADPEGARLKTELEDIMEYFNDCCYDQTGDLESDDDDDDDDDEEAFGDDRHGFEGDQLDEAQRGGGDGVGSRWGPSVPA